MLYDPRRRWLDRAVCRKLDSSLFFAPGGQPNRSPHPNTQALWDEAKEVCSYCPVLAQCRRDTAGEEYGVWGGLDEHERWLRRARLSKKKTWQRWPEELRMEWGEHLHKLREQGVQYRDIQLRTGLVTTVVDGLIAQWLAAQPEAEPQAEVVELKSSRAVPDFPTADGRRHAWVRNNGLIADAWYRGHTEDGVWVRMQLYSGRGNVIKFFKAEDVRFYHPQPPWIVPYTGRPDADDVQEDAHAA